jgi:predicted O-methyltransferase YrrM
MDPAFTAVFQEYEERQQREHAKLVAAKTQKPLAARNEMLLAVGEDTARLLNMLIKASRARNILEIGTSYGYSTLWLAEAARAVGGRVVTLELAPEKVAFASRPHADRRPQRLDRVPRRRRPRQSRGIGDEV